VQAAYYQHKRLNSNGLQTQQEGHGQAHPARGSTRGVPFSLEIPLLGDGSEISAEFRSWADERTRGELAHLFCHEMIEA